MESVGLRWFGRRRAWGARFEGVGFLGREGVGSEENRPTERRIDVEGECIAKQDSWKWDTSFQPDQFFFLKKKIEQHEITTTCREYSSTRDDLEAEVKGVLERYYHLRAHPRWKGFIAPWTVRH